MADWSVVGSPTTYATTSATSIVLSKPTGVAEGDIMFALLSSYGATDPTSVPSGWTRIGHNVYGSTYLWDVFYKIAGASEGADYTWGWAGSVKRVGVAMAYRGGFDTSDPIDVVSDTAYTVNSTTVRAASITVAAAGSPLVFMGMAYNTAARTYTAPADYTEDADWGHTDGDFWETFASRVWSGSGATGDVDATLSSAQAAKHAFLVALNPATAPPPAADLFLDGV